MSLAEELLADLEDGYDDCEPMIIQEEPSNELQDNTLIPKQTGTLLNMFINSIPKIGNVII